MTVKEMAAYYYSRGLWSAARIDALAAAGKLTQAETDEIKHGLFQKMVKVRGYQGAEDSGPDRGGDDRNECSALAGGLGDGRLCVNTGRGAEPFDQRCGTA